MITSSRTRNPRGNGTRLRDEIVDAAIALIDETNEAGALTLRGIARKAGISAPSIYPHFGDLPTLIEAVLSESFRELSEVLAQSMREHEDPVEALLAGARAYVQFGWDHRARYRLMFASSGYAPDAADSFALIEVALRRCVSSGQSESIDPRSDTFLIWVSMHGMATLEKPGRDDLLRLGPLDRPALLRLAVARTAFLRAS